MEISTITMEDVSLSLADTEILSKLNIKFKPGIHCFLGPNGSGKTMTNRLLGLIEEASSGKIYWNETIVNPIDEKDKLENIRNIGYMRQEPVFVNRSVIDNIVLPLHFRSLEDWIISEKLDHVIDLFDIDSIMDQNIYTLSTGQRQKIALARTLITDPEVIILDEPTSSLDLATTRWFEQFILNLQQEEKKIIIWTTHDQFQVKRIANRLSILLDGCVLITGDADTILSNPPAGMVKNYLQGELVEFSNSDKK